MTIRKDISVIQNRWHDAQRVDQTDMDTEQNQNNQIHAAIVNNHFGSGVLPSAPEQTILFDSDDLPADQAALLAAGNFDGVGHDIHTQPSDINLGNQLEVELTDSDVVGRFSVKVAIIGLSFDGTIQCDRFYFYRNEKQVTSKHYKSILTVFTNDFKGNHNCSRDLGGRLVIRETASFQLSRDPVMAAQDVEPDLFWRDFKVAELGTTLAQHIQAGIGSEYSVDGLDINTTGRTDRTLEPDDVTSQIGQKFLATTNNIQKVTLLLGVSDDETVDLALQHNWTGDLIVSIYALQTTTNSPTDIVPELAIDFDPAYEPLAQISYNQTTLQSYGYVLNNVLQPVDFVFNATAVGSVASGGVIEAGKFYAVTVKRSGAAGTGTFLIGVGNNRVDDSHVTLFSGVWVDVPEEDLWFQIWTNAAKVADGQAYDAGNGMLIAKTSTDAETGAVIDHQARHYSFASTGENVLNTAIIQATSEESITIQDERTGNSIYSRKQFVPSFSFVTEAELSTLQETSEPLIIGAMQDTNPKTNPSLEKIQSIPGLARTDQFCIVNPDADLLSLNLLGSILTPNSGCCTDTYRIFKVTLCTDGYGDVNGDGVIDAQDVTLASTLIGESIFFESSQQKIHDGFFDTLQLLRADVDGDGYVTSNDVDLITEYVNKSINAFPAGSSFQHMCLKVQMSTGRNDGYYDCDGYVRLDGYYGQNVVDPGDLTAAELLFDGYMVTPMLESDDDFTAVPFLPITYQITPQPYWQPWLLATNSNARQVPASFTFATAIVHPSCTAPVTFECEDKNDISPEADPGRNDIMFPNNVYIGDGEILRPDGNHYKVDFEIGTIILNLPEGTLTESVINIVDKFVIDRGAGFTSAGYPAMRYADCSTVQATDLAAGKIRFSVSLQSVSPDTDGYGIDGYGIVDDLIGIHLDSTTGILSLSVNDLSVHPIYNTLVSKVQILVYLKKAGWNNTPLVVSEDEVAGLISS